MEKFEYGCHLRQTVGMLLFDSDAATPFFDFFVPGKNFFNVEFCGFVLGFFRTELPENMSYIFYKAKF